LTVSWRKNGPAGATATGLGGGLCAGPGGGRRAGGVFRRKPSAMPQLRGPVKGMGGRRDRRGGRKGGKPPGGC